MHPIHRPVLRRREGQRVHRRVEGQEAGAEFLSRPSDDALSLLHSLNPRVRDKATHHGKGLTEDELHAGKLLFWSGRRRPVDGLKAIQLHPVVAHELVPCVVDTGQHVDQIWLRVDGIGLLPGVEIDDPISIDAPIAGAQVLTRMVPQPLARNVVEASPAQRSGQVGLWLLSIAGGVYRIVVYQARLRGLPRNLPGNEAVAMIALRQEQVMRSPERKPTLAELRDGGARIVASPGPVNSQTRLHPLGTSRVLAYLLRRVPGQPLPAPVWPLRAS